MFSGKLANQVDSVTQSSQTSSTNTATAALTRDPHRLQALCKLWCGTERDLWLTLKGTSMMPSIHPGSRLHLRCDLIDPKLIDASRHTDRVHRMFASSRRK